MNSEQLILMQYARIIWSDKNILIRNVIITAIVVSILSLIMPKTFKSTAVLMLSKSNSDNTLISQIGEIAIGNFLDDGQNSESNTIFAILKRMNLVSEFLVVALVTIFSSIREEILEESSTLRLVLELSNLSFLFIVFVFLLFNLTSII